MQSFFCTFEAVFCTFTLKGIEMSSKKIRYLLEEKGRYYYQRKVPKALLYYVGFQRWHIPVGKTFDGAQIAVAKLRAEHDALIAKAKAEPEERTRLRRAKEDREADRQLKESIEDVKYRADVLAGIIDDPEELIVAEYEEAVINVEPSWMRVGDWLKALEHERTADISWGIAVGPVDEIFTLEKFEAQIEPVKEFVSPEQVEEWRSQYVGVAGLRWGVSLKRKMEDDEYYDNIKATYDACFSSTEEAPIDEDERLEWDIIKMKLERLMARYAPPADRLSAVFKRFLAFNGIKTEAKYKRVFGRFVTHTGDIPIAQVTPRMLREYRDDLLSRDLSIASVKAAFTPLKSLFRYALDEEIVEINPTHSVTFPKDNRPIGEIKHLAFEPTEVRQILKAIDEFWLHPFPYLDDERRIAIRHVVRALVFTAARPIEIMSLKRKDVSDAAINIRRTKTKSSWRFVPVHPEISDFPAFVQNGGIECLLTNNQDLVEPVRHNFMRLLRKLMEPPILEPRKTLYSFRHTFQDALRRAGTPMEVRQAILGHTEGGAIKHYNSGPEFELMREWVNKADPRI